MSSRHLGQLHSTAFLALLNNRAGNAHVKRCRSPDQNLSRDNSPLEHDINDVAFLFLFKVCKAHLENSHYCSQHHQAQLYDTQWTPTAKAVNVTPDSKPAPLLQLSMSPENRKQCCIAALIPTSASALLWTLFSAIGVSRETEAASALT